MKTLSLSLSAAFLAAQIGCATALQLPSRKSNPQYFAQEVNDNYIALAQEFYKDMERATYITVKHVGKYNIKFFPITKPLIISNANGMVLEKHIQKSQKNQFRDNALSAFGDGKRCFQIWQSHSPYNGIRTEISDKVSDDKYWKFTVLNKDRKFSLTSLSEEYLLNAKVNPTNFSIYASVICAKKEIDYDQDVTILVENTLYPDLKGEVSWLAPKSNKYSK